MAQLNDVRVYGSLNDWFFFRLFPKSRLALFIQGHPKLLRTKNDLNW